MTIKSIWRFLDDNELNGYRFLIPSVAVGNVGQLACDLLISSLNMTKIASVYSPALIPVVGYDPYDLDSDKLSSCCEVYKSTSKKVVALQLRAPLVYKYARDFLDDVVKTFKDKGIQDIIILTSSFAHEKKHILTSPFRYIANDVCVYKKQIAALNWLEHEHTDSSLHIFGGGFASLLYDISNGNDVPCLVLYKYCSEGDNIPDSYEMVKQLTEVLPLFSDSSELSAQLVQPVSWKLLFGRPPPCDIY